VEEVVVLGLRVLLLPWRLLVLEERLVLDQAL
jgi:hypothetical protein